MEITISLKDAGLILIGIGLIVLIGYMICLTKNLVATVKSTNKILKDAEVISAIASEKAQEIDGVIGDVSESVGHITELIKGNQSIVKALTNIVNSLSALKCLFTDKNDVK